MGLIAEGTGREMSASCCFEAPASSDAPLQPTIFPFRPRLPLLLSADTIMDCDQLLVLSAGRVVEQGAPGVQRCHRCRLPLLLQVLAAASRAVLCRRKGIP